MNPHYAILTNDRYAVIVKDFKYRQATCTKKCVHRIITGVENGGIIITPCVWSRRHQAFVSNGRNDKKRGQPVRMYSKEYIEEHLAPWIAKARNTIIAAINDQSL